MMVGLVAIGGAVLMSFLIWNIRGLSSFQKQEIMKEFIFRHKISLFGLSETMLQTVDDRIIRSCWGRIGNPWVFSPSRGRSGGLPLSWDANEITVVKQVTNNSWIAVDLAIPGVGLCSLVSVYCPTSRGERLGVLLEIENLVRSWNHPFLLVETSTRC